MDLEGFKQQHQPAHRRSRLDPHADEIAALLVDGYSYAQVVTWLAAKGIAITKQSLGEWVRRRKQAPPRFASAGTYEPATRSTDSPSYADDMPEAPPQPPLPSSSPAALDAIIGKPVNLDAYAKRRKRK